MVRIIVRFYIEVLYEFYFRGRLGLFEKDYGLVLVGFRVIRVRVLGS